MHTTDLAEVPCISSSSQSTILGFKKAQSSSTIAKLQEGSGRTLDRPGVALFDLVAFKVLIAPNRIQVEDRSF